ncbi:hypothetical protein TSMEX_005194 [Taenia solium]|eukprot:TsM_000653500 transcript=TsM_000653500 gene=TsM_000653500
MASSGVIIIYWWTRARTPVADYSFVSDIVSALVYLEKSLPTMKVSVLGLASEVLQENLHHARSGIWSLGMMLRETLAGHDSSHTDLPSEFAEGGFRTPLWPPKSHGRLLSRLRRCEIRLLRPVQGTVLGRKQSEANGLISHVYLYKNTQELSLQV